MCGAAVTAGEVVAEAIPGAVTVVLECPDEQHLPALLAEPTLRAFQVRRDKKVYRYDFCITKGGWGRLGSCHLLVFDGSG
jgi:hypothetical protein